MIRYPLQFKAVAEGEAGISRFWWTSSTIETALTCAVPPEFDGPGGGYSPEDLLAMAAANCFVATFKVFAEKSQVTFDGVKVHTTLVVDRDQSGKPEMAEIQLRARVSAGQGDSARIRRVLEKTSTSCLVLNALKCRLNFEFEVTA